MQKRIQVFIGGSTNDSISDAYNTIAIELGKEINKRDYDIIFDGCYGLPYLLFNQIKDTSRAKIWTTKYYSNSYMYLTHSNLCKFDTQTEFTNAISKASDAMIFMKGNIGTVAEVVHAINAKKNKEHDAPIVLLNVNNEWDDLVNLLNSYQLNNLYYITDNFVDALNYVETELFKENSKFYTLFLSSGNYLNRKNPIIKTK